MYREEEETSRGPISGEKEGDFEENEVEEVGSTWWWYCWWPFRRRVRGHWPGVLSCLAGAVLLIDGCAMSRKSWLRDVEISAFIGRKVGQCSDM